MDLLVAVERFAGQLTGVISAGVFPGLGVKKPVPYLSIRRFLTNIVGSGANETAVVSRQAIATFLANNP